MLCCEGVIIGWSISDGFGLGLISFGFWYLGVCMAASHLGLGLVSRGSEDGIRGLGGYT
jgi:hypothetical protein